MKKTFLLVLVIVVQNTCAQPPDQGDLARDLRTFSVKVEKDGIIEHIAYFLRSDLSQKKSMTWLKGSIQLRDGRVFENLDLKLNTINNSLYLLNNDQFYKVSSDKLSYFTLFFNNKEHLFRKGYAILHDHQLVVNTPLEIADVLKYIFTYENVNEMSISNTQASRDKDMTHVELTFKSAHSSKSYDFQKFISQHDSIWDVQILQTKPDVSENTFLEVMVNKEGFELLKWHFKNISRNESLTLIKHTSTHIYDQKKFFLANRNQELNEIYLAKKSIKQGLEFLDLAENTRVPFIKSESKLVSWFDESF